MRKFLLCALLIFLFSCQASAEPSVIDTYTAPELDLAPTDCVVLENTTAMFNVKVYGAEPLTYQWQRTNDKGGTWDGIDGANNNFYSLNAQTSDNGSQYRVIISNAYGTLTTDVRSLQVVSADAPPVVSIINARGVGLILISTDCAIQSKAVGSEPLTYQWQRGGDIYGDGRDDILEWIDINGENAADYSFFVQDNSSGYYRVVVSNSYGSGISDYETLIVNYPHPPAYTDGRVSGCNSVGGVLGILTLLPAFWILCRKKI